MPMHPPSSFLPAAVAVTTLFAQVAAAQQVEVDEMVLDNGMTFLLVPRSEEPNTILISNGWCSMGFALPGAIGAKLVYPDRRVLAICGDGGVMMNIQDLETAVREKTKIVVMVWEDNAYGLISWKQDTHFGQHTDLAFGNPDWVMLAKSFGWHGHYVGNAADLKGTLQSAFAEDGPSLVVIPIDYRENPLLTKKLGEIQCAI